MKILLTGGTGLLGKALIENDDNRFEIIATYIGSYEMQDNDRVKYLKLDIRNQNGYMNLFQNFKPDVAIHTAGIGSPDFAEKNQELVWDININGTKNMLQMCGKYNCKFIFISSNGIYDGQSAPYSEEDKAEPVNFYGEVKLKGEEIVVNSNITFAIVRPILMYGWHYPFERGNIVTQAIYKLRNNETIHAYDDVYVNPLYSNSCAAAIWKIVNDNKYGIFNIAGADRVNIYQLVNKAAEIFNLRKDIVIPVKQGFFNELAKRPFDTSFRTNKMEEQLGIKALKLEDGLTNMRKTMV